MEVSSVGASSTMQAYAAQQAASSAPAQQAASAAPAETGENAYGGRIDVSA